MERFRVLKTQVDSFLTIFDSLVVIFQFEVRITDILPKPSRFWINVNGFLIALDSLVIIFRSVIDMPHALPCIRRCRIV